MFVQYINYSIQRIILEYLDIYIINIKCYADPKLEDVLPMLFKILCDINLLSWLIDVFSITKNDIIVNNLIYYAYRNNNINTVEWICKKFKLSKKNRIMHFISFRSYWYGIVYHVQFDVLSRHNKKKNNVQQLLIIMNKLLTMGYCNVDAVTYNNYKDLSKRTDYNTEKLCKDFMIKQPIKKYHISNMYVSKGNRVRSHARLKHKYSKRLVKN